MRMSEALALRQRMTYKAGWRFELVEDLDGFGCILRIVNKELDATRKVAGMISLQGSTTLPPLDFLDERQFLLLIRRGIHDREIHEADEWLQLDGAAPFYPH